VRGIGSVDTIAVIFYEIKVSREEEIVDPLIPHQRSKVKKNKKILNFVPFSLYQFLEKETYIVAFFI